MSDAGSVSGDDCCICLESLGTAVGRQTLPCGHVFHKHCVANLRCLSSGSGCCPLCRGESDALTSVEGLVDRALESRRRGAYTVCAQLATEALDLQPKNAFASSILGELYARGRGVPKDSSRASQLFEDGRRGGDPTASTGLGHICLQSGQKQRAQQLFEEGYRGGSAQAATALGQLYLSNKYSRHTARVQELFEEGMQGGDLEATTALGEIYMRKGEISRAAECFEEGRLGGEVTAVAALGRLYEQQGQTSQARELFEEGRRLGSAEAATGLGSLYLRQGMHMKAQELLEEGRRGGDGRAVVALGVLHWGTGRVSEAKELLEQARAFTLAPEGLDHLADLIARPTPTKIRSECGRLSPSSGVSPSSTPRLRSGREAGIKSSLRFAGQSMLGQVS